MSRRVRGEFGKKLRWNLWKEVISLWVPLIVPPRDLAWQDLAQVRHAFYFELYSWYKNKKRLHAVKHYLEILEMLRF